MVTTNTFNGSIESNKLKNRATHMIEEDFIEPTQEYLAKARDFGVNALERGSHLVRENPGYTIIGAAAVGFLLGAYVARRK